MDKNPTKIPHGKEINHHVLMAKIPRFYVRGQPLRWLWDPRAATKVANRDTLPKARRLTRRSSRDRNGIN